MVPRLLVTHFMVTQVWGLILAEMHNGWLHSGDFCCLLITCWQLLLSSGWVVKGRDCYDKHCLWFLHTVNTRCCDLVEPTPSKLNGACKSTMAVYMPDALVYQSPLRNAAVPSAWPASEYLMIWLLHLIQVMHADKLDGSDSPDSFTI